MLEDFHVNDSSEDIEILIPGGEKVTIHSSNGRDKFEFVADEFGDSVILHPGDSLSSV